MYQNILVATDGSDAAARALDQALALAKLLGSKVTVMTVTEPSALIGAGYAGIAGTIVDPIPELIQALDEAAKALLADASKKAEAAGVAVTTSVVPDWTLCHELIHLGIPALDRQQHWFEEGIATYVEPIIRYRLGEVSRDQFWEELTAGLQRGLPQAGDGGLDQARTWGSTYWGGALFCFLADVELRGFSCSAWSVTARCR